MSSTPTVVLRIETAPFVQIEDTKTHKQVLIAGEPVEAIAEPVEAIAEPNPVTVGGDCKPWVRLERDPKAMAACMARANAIGPIKGSKELFELVRADLERQDQEHFIIIGLDVQLHLRAMSEIARGARDRVLTPVDDTARYAIAYVLEYGCRGIAIAHNHPSGKSKPSEADRHVTKAMKRMCDVLEILFVDHIVVGMGNYYSFRDNKAL